MTNEYIKFKEGKHIVSSRGCHIPGAFSSPMPVIIDSFYKTNEGLYHSEHYLGHTGQGALMLTRAFDYFSKEPHKKLENTKISSESSSLLTLLKEDFGKNQFKKGHTLTIENITTQKRIPGKILKSKKMKNASLPLYTDNKE